MEETTAATVDQWGKHAKAAKQIDHELNMHNSVPARTLTWDTVIVLLDPPSSHWNPE